MHGGVQADGRHHILQRAVLGGGIERIVDRDQRHTRLVGQRLRLDELARVAARAVHDGPEPDAARRGLAQGFQQLQRGTRQGDQQQIVDMLQKVAQIERAFALFGAAIAGREQAREPAPSMARLRIGDDVARAVRKDQTGARDELEILRNLNPFFLQALDGDLRPHHARDGVAIGNADALVAQPEGPLDHFPRRARAVQEAVGGRAGQFDIGGGIGRGAHANSPCTYQSGASVSRP